ncbi:uncharacterized protein LOC123548304 [Mercenaria mercenaria]|uniref:uncharacterized protein LOC123548304 n=1 Tax=Mercenaria mercenaria TaxID=6596 RepID=UPI00234E5B53|nr:uncharacterized protein LOC123548304 [Mercenaria mercenaria]
MESLCHILCVRCYSAIGKDNEVLLCSSCKLWQHRKCSQDVSQNFYLEFYLATVLGEKPAPWTCHYCSQYQQMVKHERLSPSKGTNTTPEKNLNSSLLLPPNPPASLASDNNSGYDSDSSSFDEFSPNCEIQRVEREGPASLPVSVTTSADNQTIPVPVGHKVIINSQPIFSDTSREPTLYTLYQTANGQKEVIDSVGNVFTSTEVICGAVALYQCSTANCGFKVRACETIQEFLSAGSQSTEDHNHNSVSAAATTGNTAADNDSDSDTTYTEDERSFILPDITATPFNTPARRKCVSTRFSDSYCSDSTDDEDSNPLPLPTSIQRFSALNHPTPRVSLNVSFSSDSDSDDDCAISVLCDLLNNSSDEDIDRIPPSPTSTIPAMDSSDSSDSENNSVAMATTFHVTKGTSSGERALLTDSLGFTYNIKFKLETRTFWCCTEKSRSCPASVIQSTSGHFTMGVASHNHLSIQLRIHIPSLTPPPLLLDQSQQGAASSDHLSTTTESTPTYNMPVLKPETNTPSPVSTDPNEPEPETNIVVTEPDEETVFHEIEACLPRQKKPGSLLVSSDGFIFQTKIEDACNNKTSWHCTETAPNGTKCEASVVFEYLQPFSHDPATGRTWLVNRENGRCTGHHNHTANHCAVVLAKVRMMIRRKIFLYGVLDEVPNTLIPNIFKSLDYEGLTYLDSIGSPVLTTADKDYLPCSPVQIQVLRRFVSRQKVLYRQEKKNNEHSQKL